MTGIRNIVFCTFVALLSFSLLGALTANAVGLVQMPEKSYLEGHEYQKFPKVSARQVLSREFQKEFESFAADHIPARSELMLANAAVQRQGIRTANLAARFNAIPTFYGSRYVVADDKPIVLSQAVKVNPTTDKNVEAMIGTLNKVAKDNPDVNFVMDTILTPTETKYTPTATLTSGKKVNEKWVQKNIIDRMDSSIVTILDGPKSREELSTIWTVTEHHWTLERALRNYNLLAEKLDLKKVEYEGAVQVSDEWYGGYARTGLCLDYRSTLWDMPTDYSHLSVYPLGKVEKGKEISLGKREAVLAGETTLNAETKYSGYDDYYGEGGKEVVNNSSNNGKTCLVISDSYSHAVWRVIADNYAHTAFVLPGNDETNKSLQDFIDEYQPDDVVWMMHSTKCNKVASVSPSFIGLSGEPKGASANGKG